MKVDREAVPVASSEQQSFAWEVGPEQRELGEGCRVELFAGFVTGAEEEALMTTLPNALPWAQEFYLRGGAVVPAPRLTSFHGDPDCAYSYSGIDYAPAAWPDVLASLRDRVRRASGVGFNCMLANHYRDGRDSVGFHADDEPELGPSRDDIAIASISLGARRRFVLKHKTDGRRLHYDLGHGDLLLMRGRTQQRFIHAVPKTTTPVGPRINLTFRVVTNAKQR